MTNYTIFARLDLLADSIQIAIARSGKQDAENIRFIKNDSASVVKIVKRSEENGGEPYFLL